MVITRYYTTYRDKYFKISKIFDFCKNVENVKGLNAPSNQNTIRTESNIKNNYKDTNFYEITQNIRNGLKLNQAEIEYITHLQKHDLIELIMLYDECMDVYVGMIKNLI